MEICYYAVGISLVIGLTFCLDRRPAKPRPEKPAGAPLEDCGNLFGL